MLLEEGDILTFSAEKLEDLDHVGTQDPIIDIDTNAVGIASN